MAHSSQKSSEQTDEENRAHFWKQHGFLKQHGFSGSNLGYKGDDLQ